MTCRVCLVKGAPPQGRHQFFTLVEMLVVLTLFALAAIAVTTVAGGGLRIFRRAQFVSVYQTDLLLGLERMEKDLRGCFVFDTIPFEGSASHVSFPAMVSRWDGSGRTFTRAPGRVTYRLDPLAGGLIRRDQNYSQATKEDGGGNDRLLATDVDLLQFSYCKYDARGEKYIWQTTWGKEDEGVPAAVKLRMKVSAPGGISNFERTLLLPAGSQPWQPPAPDRSEKAGTVE